MPITCNRDSQKAQTRGRLIECAHGVFLRHGFHAATLEQIAREAGVTKGAVYASFASKAELFLAVSASRMEERLRGYQRVRAAVTGLDTLVREYVAIMLRHDPDGRWASVVVEAWAVAASDEGFRAALIAQSARGNAVIADAMEDLADRAGSRFRLTREKMSTLCTALMRGLLLQRLLDPAAVSREFIAESLVAVIHSMLRPRTQLRKRKHHDQHSRRSGYRAAARGGAQRAG